MKLEAKVDVFSVLYSKSRYFSEDAIQEVGLRYLLTPDRFEKADHLPSYVHQAIRNVESTFSKSCKTVSGIKFDVSSRGNPPDREVENSEVCRIVRDVIDTLPTKDRELACFCLSGMETCRSFALRKGQKLEAILSRKKRLLSKLRKHPILRSIAEGDC